MPMVTIILAIDDNDDGWILTWRTEDDRCNCQMQEDVRNHSRCLNNGWGNIQGLPILSPGVWEIEMSPMSEGPNYVGEYNDYWIVESSPKPLYAVPVDPKKVISEQLKREIEEE